MTDDFQAELRFLGIASSPAFVRAPRGQRDPERFIRTLKEQLLWVRTFQTVEDHRRALHDRLWLYNEQWLVERHGFRSPDQVRRDFLAPWLPHEGTKESGGLEDHWVVTNTQRTPLAE